jgi:hypothetical protein
MHQDVVSLKEFQSMTLLFYLVLNLVALILYIRKNKNLHILEIMVYWMFGSYLFQNFSALCYMNFKTLIVPNVLSLEIAHFLNRINLFPLLMVIFLDFFIMIKQLIKKILLFIGFLFLFLALEWLADFLKILIHVHWRVWWSFSYWILILLVLIGIMKIFRKILYKGELKS